MLQKIEPENLTDNVFRLIDKEWMLIAAGTPDAFNMMTASWGGLGILWNKKVVFCFIRPTRYTYEFTEKNGRFSINVFPEKDRPQLNLCGTQSGREIDKMNVPGLTPTFEYGAVAFQEARLIFVCKKIYFQDLIPGQFLAPEIEKSYPQHDYHRMYIGEIEACYSNPEL